MVDHKTTLHMGEIQIWQPYEPYGWTILYQISLATLVQNALFPTILIAVVGLLFIGATVAISHTLARYISQPLVMLNQTIQTVQSGDMNVRAAALSNDEIGQLALDFNSMMDHIQSLMAQIKQVESDKRHYEVELIQSQINPHFLYNSFETICSLAILEKTDELLYMVDCLSGFYRGVLSGGKNVVEVRTELETVRRYLDILKIRYDNLDYTIHAASDVLSNRCVKMTVQPLVENCIVHGFKRLERRWRIRINAYRKNEQTVIEVIDNGIGFGENTNAAFGFGLRSVDQRIKMYFGQQYGIRVVPGRFCGTKIQMIFP